jgi:hypothetical protein
MSSPAVGQVLDGLWRFEARHPEWTEDEGGEEGWEPVVGWWAAACSEGVVLIDPLVVDWPGLDAVVRGHGGCAGIIRTCHWHQRSIPKAAARYGAEVWARPHPDIALPADRAMGDRDEPWDGVQVFDVERADEIAVWLGRQRALVFGDAMLRNGDGQLRVCPESWTQPAGGRARLIGLLSRLGELPVEHVLVSHGPLVLRDGLASLRCALGGAHVEPA